ncbi:MAG: LPXTG cell wall anchor domain-containing protein [Ilumatobacteraceae bacterium]
MNRIRLAVLAIDVIALTAVTFGCDPSLRSAHGAPLGPGVPANCVEHTPINTDEFDVSGDYRCAGVVIRYHTAGVGQSTSNIWAGQWLFLDSDRQYRVGSCTLNRGVHPTSVVPAAPVTQRFPNDLDGTKGAYLSWKYGESTDNLTAAAMWAVFHYYAQDSAGSKRADNPTDPLVPSLGSLASMSGHAELQTKAVALAAEADQFVATWTLTVTVDVDGDVGVVVRSGDRPVEGARVLVAAGGGKAEAVVTDAGGQGRVAVPVEPGMLRVQAATSAPGAAMVFRGTPSQPNPFGSQTLVTGGPAVALRADAEVNVPLPTSTTEQPTTTTTEQRTTTTTDSPTTTEQPTTTVQPTTVAPTESTTTTGPSTTATSIPPEPSTTTSTVPGVQITSSPSTRPELPRTELPSTGGSSDRPAYIGTALLVAGIGLIGTVRRRANRQLDFDWES